MDPKLFFEIINGNFDNIPKAKSKIVRIFLSSTFSGNFSCIKLLHSKRNIDLHFEDTHTERDYLISHVYPKLKEYCKKQYNLEFQVFIC